MKIAYLVTVYNNYKHLDRLLASLDSDFSDIYIHFDAKYRNDSDLKKYSKYKAYSHLSITWGGFSLIDSIIFLVNEAKKFHQYDYFVMVSGSDYPIRSKGFIKKYFMFNLGKQFINIKSMPTADKPINRVNKYFVDAKSSNKVLIKFVHYLNVVLKILPYKRVLPAKYKNLKLFAGTACWALTNDCVDYVLSYINKNKDLTNYYRKCFCPDEMFIHTIIGNSPFYNDVANTITYTDWSKGGAHPATITEEYLDFFKEQNKLGHDEKQQRVFLFARKFNDNSGKVIEKINQLTKQGKL